MKEKLTPKEILTKKKLEHDIQKAIVSAHVYCDSNKKTDLYILSQYYKEIKTLQYLYDYLFGSEYILQGYYEEWYSEICDANFRFYFDILKKVDENDEN